MYILNGRAKLELQDCKVFELPTCKQSRKEARNAI